MKFDNKGKAIKLRFSSFLVVIATLIIILFIVYTDIADPLTDLGVSKTMLIIMVIGILFLIAIWRYILDLNYVFFSDEGPDITIRYASLRPFTSSKNAVVIQKNKFENFKVKTYLLGLKPYLILTVRTDFDKKVNYPPISLTGLKKTQRKRLVESLSNIR